jgi:hypothetical protein
VARPYSRSRLYSSSKTEKGRPCELRALEVEVRKLRKRARSWGCVRSLLGQYNPALIIKRRLILPFVSKWIYHVLIKELGLSTEPAPTVEATPKDVILITKVLWERSEDIPCAPLIRISFYNAVVMGSIVGFRPKAMTGTLTFSQFEAFLVRDLDNSSRIVPVINVEIDKVKQKAKLANRGPSRLVSFISYLYLFISRA